MQVSTLTSVITVSTLKMQMRTVSHLSNITQGHMPSAIYLNITHEKDRYIFLPNSIMICMQGYRRMLSSKQSVNLSNVALESDYRRMQYWQCPNAMRVISSTSTSTILYTFNLASNFSKQIILNEIRKSISLSHKNCSHKTFVLYSQRWRIPGSWEIPYYLKWVIKGKSTMT